jgi:DNA-binding GntR family transcriptional regulator
VSDPIIRLPVRAAARSCVIDRIVKGTLPAGRAINLAALAEELNVSPTPLREALIELERDGFVECSQGRGFFVHRWSAAEIQDLYALIPELEVLGLRGTPPPDSARLKRLEAINAELRAAADPASAIELDLLWHTTLLTGCSNQTLLEMLRGLKQRAQRYEFAFLQESGHRVSSEQHAGIVRALRKKDLKRAVGLLRENWNIGPRFLMPWLKRRQNQPVEPKQRPMHGTRFDSNPASV